MTIYKVTYDQNGNEDTRLAQDIEVFRQEPITKLLVNKNGANVQTSARLFCKPNFIFDYSDRVIYKFPFQGIEKDLISVQDQYNLSNVLEHYEVYI